MSLKSVQVDGSLEVACYKENLELKPLIKIIPSCSEPKGICMLTQINVMCELRMF